VPPFKRNEKGIAFVTVYAIFEAMDNSEVRRLQQEYIEESNAFLECLRQKVSMDILEKKRQKIREISRLIDEKSRDLNSPKGNNPRSS
jgi:hypothetical protein